MWAEIIMLETEKWVLGFFRVISLTEHVGKITTSGCPPELSFVSFLCCGRS